MMATLDLTPSSCLKKCGYWSESIKKKLRLRFVLQAKPWMENAVSSKLPGWKHVSMNDEELARPLQTESGFWKMLH